VGRVAGLPGPRGWFLLLIVVLELGIAPLIWAAIAKPCGELVRHLLGITLEDPAARATWANLFTTAFVALACGFGLLLSLAPQQNLWAKCTHPCVRGSTGASSLSYMVYANWIDLQPLGWDAGMGALVMWAALYLNHKLPRAYRTRWPVLVGGVASAVALSAFAAISGWGLAVKLLGT